MIIFLLHLFLFAEITVDLNSPSYSGGILSTDGGGIISAPRFHLQASHIQYDRKTETVEAEGNLLLTFDTWILVGDRITYNFKTGHGTLYEGRSGLPPWYFGGKEIHLLPSHDLIIKGGYGTSSPTFCPNWKIESGHISLNKNHDFYIQRPTIVFGKVGLTYLPYFRGNIDWLIDSPVKWRVRWGGRLGPRIGMNYQLFQRGQLKGYLRLDYRTERGPGGGIETSYHSCDEHAHTINYVARDGSNDDTKLKTRYRFQGIYHRNWENTGTSLDFSYDSVSDEKMPTDYQDKGLSIQNARMTQAHIRHQHDQNWIANIFSRVRINDFQSVKQELPTLTLTTKPVCFLGFIHESTMRFSYLDFVFQESPKHLYATRFQFFHRSYTSCRVGPIIFTPDFGGAGYAYNNEQFGIFSTGAKAEVDIWKLWGCSLHRLVPYADYRFMTNSFSATNRDIFDISDGITHTNFLRAGIRNSLCNLSNDTYTYMFFNQYTIPRLYTDLTWRATSRSKFLVGTSLYFPRNQIDTLNLRGEVTLSDNLAVATEYRTRGKHAWRKADPENFFLESHRGADAGALGSKRQVFLSHIYWKMGRHFASEAEYRCGWDRTEKGFAEYQINFHIDLPDSWKVRLSYQEKENGKHYSLNFSI